MRACPPPGRGRGTGPDGDKFRRGGTQETLGGAEAKRSPEEGLCPALAKRPDIKKKPAKNLFLVGLIWRRCGRDSNPRRSNTLNITELNSFILA